jgi:hypothetical protein
MPYHDLIDCYLSLLLSYHRGHVLLYSTFAFWPLFCFDVVVSSRALQNPRRNFNLMVSHESSSQVEEKSSSQVEKSSPKVEKSSPKVDPPDRPF